MGFKTLDEINTVLETMENVCKLNTRIVMLPTGKRKVDVILLLLEPGEKKSEVKYWFDEFGYSFSCHRNFMDFEEVYVFLKSHKASELIKCFQTQ